VPVIDRRSADDQRRHGEHGGVDSKPLGFVRGHRGDDRRHHVVEVEHGLAGEVRSAPQVERRRLIRCARAAGGIVQPQPRAHSRDDHLAVGKQLGQPWTAGRTLTGREGGCGVTRRGSGVVRIGARDTRRHAIKRSASSAESPPRKRQPASARRSCRMPRPGGRASAAAAVWRTAR
jgi:hypothetical protein